MEIEENLNRIKREIEKANKIVILTGAGISAESGIPTFRGSSGLWANYKIEEVATPEGWEKNPCLVWEFYNKRRKELLEKKPNPAHISLAKFEEKYTKKGKSFTIITQNVDDLHLEAGSKNVIRLHGSLWNIKCTKCNYKEENKKVPITSGFSQKDKIEIEDLPKCPQCNSLLRPDVVWFGEQLEPDILERAIKEAEEADIFVVIGTSAVVYPAAGLVHIAKGKTAVIVEINLEKTDITHTIVDYFFEGKAGELVPLIFE